MEQGYSFKFSIIIAVYNVGPFLAEAVDSVLQQDIGFEENVQLILVDDGSTDGSGDICDEYQGRFPGNIIVRHKENGGVSSARNEGLGYIQGEYINFLDGDDKLSLDTLSIVYGYFKQWEEETDLVTIPLKFFDGQTGNHVLNNKFHDGPRVIYVKREYNKPLFSLSASFVKNEIIRKYSFDEGLPLAEDGKVALQILLENMSYGVIPEAEYCYRRRTEGITSAVQKSLYSKARYTDYIELFSLWALNYSREKLGFIPRFVQYMVMYDLQWHFRTEKIPPNILTSREYAAYKENLHQILQCIDNDIVNQQRNLFIDHKIFLLSLKNNTQPQAVKEKDDLLYYFGNENIGFVSKWVTKLQFLSIQNDSIIIEGITVIMGNADIADIQLFMLLNDRMVECGPIDVYEYNYTLDEVMSTVFRFKAHAGLEMGEVNECKFFLRIGGQLVEKKNITFGKFFPVQKALKSSYYAVNGYIISYMNNELIIKPHKFMRHIVKELAVYKELLCKKNRPAWKALAARVLYRLASVFPQKERWLISDRIDIADDNGEALFEYVKKEHKSEVQAVFSIAKESGDYRRLKKAGKVVPFGGWRYKWYYLRGAKIISSQAEDYIFRPFQNYTPYYSDLVSGSRLFFLQHGIIKDDLSRWLKRYNKDLALFVTSTMPEKQSILAYNYGYTEKEVKLTGLTRYDKLYHDEKKYITLIPSWRSYLVGDINIYTGRREPVPGFGESAYCSMYSKILSSPRLIEAAQKHGYTVRYFCHPNMSECTEFLDIDPSVAILSHETETYRKIFAESALLITDYSSVAFDFAYLRKPVIYYQADYEEFFSGNHTYDKGYFDYERDGFGEVEYLADELVQRVVEYMENGCALKEKYRERIDRTFPYNDQENCRRVYEEIMKYI